MKSAYGSMVQCDVSRSAACYACVEGGKHVYVRVCEWVARGNTDTWHSVKNGFFSPKNVSFYVKSCAVVPQYVNTFLQRFERFTGLCWVDKNINNGFSILSFGGGKVVYFPHKQTHLVACRESACSLNTVNSHACAQTCTPIPKEYSTQASTRAHYNLLSNMTFLRYLQSNSCFCYLLQPPIVRGLFPRKQVFHIYLPYWS